MIVRTAAAGVWLAAICSMAAPSAGFCEVRTLPGAESALALLPVPSGLDARGASRETMPLAFGQPTLSPQPRAGVPAAVPEAPTAEAPDLSAATLNTITAPPQSLWRRLLSAIVQLGDANR